MQSVELLLETIVSRRSVSPKRLVAPGPDEHQVMQMIEAASCAPDHGRLRPWRFMLFPQQTRIALADLFETALLERLPDADEDDRCRARDKAGRGPVLLGVIVRLDEENTKAASPKTERVLRDDQYASAGAAIQNILLLSHAMGFGARATSGRAVRTNIFKQKLGLADNEQFLCFISVGTPDGVKPPKPRPSHDDLFSVWNGA